MTIAESRFLSYNPYDFSPPETFRMMWANEEIRLKLEPKIAQCSREFQSAELSTVIDQRRNGCIQTVPLENLQMGSEYMNFLRGLKVNILNYTKMRNTYSNSVEHPEKFSEAGARILISHDGTMNLGYPRCCERFFQEVWEKNGFRDTIPFQLEFQKNISDYFSSCNIMLKGLGLRIVPHLPCSMKCEATNEFAHKFKTYLSNDSLNFLDDMLSLDMKYSSYHGYAEVQTEYFKLMFNSISLGDKYECLIKRPVLIPLRKSENGFDSLMAEAKAHMELIDGISGTLLESHAGVILDLGCGDGSLLKKIGARYRNIWLEGVEINEAKARLAMKNLDGIGLVYNIDILDFRFTKFYDMIFIAAQRLHEMDLSQFMAFVAHVSKFCKFLTVYDYTGAAIDLPLGFANAIAKSYSSLFMRIMVPYAPAGTNVETRLH